MINVQCEGEGCAQDFEINFSEVEEYRQTGKRFLCPKCEAELVEAEEVRKPKRRFEYRIFEGTDYDMETLNKFGYEGWEAVAIQGTSALLKREYLE